MFGIEPFVAKRKGLGSFDCGFETLNNYLKTNALLSHRMGCSRTYLAVKQDDSQVVGYYSLSAAGVGYAKCPFPTNGMPDVIPGVHVGRLAVHQEFQRQGIGAQLLIHACKRTLQVADLVGVCFLEVHTNEETARNYYLQYGFVPYPDDRMCLMLGIKAIHDLINP